MKKPPLFAILIIDIFSRDMNRYMNDVALNTVSHFDMGNRPSDRKDPERFYLDDIGAGSLY